MSDWIVPGVPFLTEVGSSRAHGLLIAPNAVGATAAVIACGPQRLARTTMAFQK